MAARKQDETNYQELSEELQRIIEDMQSDDADIDEALKRYERGMKIVHELEDYLKTAGNTVQDITGKNAAA